MASDDACVWGFALQLQGMYTRKVKSGTTTQSKVKKRHRRRLEFKTALRHYDLRPVIVLAFFDVFQASATLELVAG